MVKVDPFKIEDIKKIKKLLKEKQERRNYFFFIFSCNSALRISDTLRVKVKDVIDSDGQIVESFTIREKKTKKSNVVYLNSNVVKALELYQQAYPKVIENPENYLFFRQKGFNGERGSEPITSCTTWRLIKKRSRMV